MSLSRRDFIKKTTVVASSLPLMGMPFSIGNEFLPSEELDVSIFSKHLQFLDYKETGQIASELGFNGVDLTVRPNGHVLPENVKTNLPIAIQDLKKGGSTCKMITTSIEGVTNPLDVDIIKTAGDNDVSFYRTNWFKYIDGISFTESLAHYQKQTHALSILNQEYNIIGCYQNHAGRSVGGSYWEVYKLLETVNPKYFGAQYDIRHALVEGGLSWENGLELLQKSIKVIVLKDFKWGQQNGKWQPINVPIGEGMVDFTTYFKLLKGYGLNPPVSLHLEYPLGGAEKGSTSLTVDKKVVYDAMKKDLNTIRKIWKAS
ncbi:sugar phosphate isomerase/epimerase family protein [Formosa sp. PL04]|uniref:sugar phosphate isomerase/epimerase family protein n=1 Tax=Formosa sp. PL04 TaxID=3081755 RepID=UPI002980D8FB|nr:TIM barrel protein [Formosa sp. PL04]MDW5287374.1 TIM barrel protein [Formosa sp. PL04]